MHPSSNPHSLLSGSLVGFIILFCATLAASFGARAGEVNQRDGVALRGYDVVAYFVEGRAVKGDASVNASRNGVAYHFSSSANRDRFLASPESYLPQFDGYCAYGVTGGYKADVSPEVFAVVDGKLYLNYSAKVGAMWAKDRDALIKKANSLWATVEKTTNVTR